MVTEQTTESAATDAAMALHELVRAVEQGIYCAPEELVVRARAVAFHAPTIQSALAKTVKARHSR